MSDGENNKMMTEKEFENYLKVLDDIVSAPEMKKWTDAMHEASFRRLKAQIELEALEERWKKEESFLFRIKSWFCRMGNLLGFCR